ncbi:light harvesting complex protein 7 [Baffinella frigidus]|nr:light harvesting complex protein 7 [Cryptophyta sp. CCMP2293]
MRMQAGDFSDAVPFLKRPVNLDGSYTGDVGFDPLGFSDVFDLRVLREAELKHGRFAMLAVLGFTVQEFYTFPFFPHMAPVDAHDYCVTAGCGSQVIFWISFVEIFGVVALFETLQGKREPGDFAFDPLGLAKSEAVLEKYRLAEIKHSRLAMIAIGGFIHQYWVTKQTVFEQLGNFKSLA